MTYAGESSKRSGSGIVAISSAKKINKVLGGGKHTPIKFVDDLATINDEDERSAGSCTYVDLDTRERFNEHAFDGASAHERGPGRAPSGPQPSSSLKGPSATRAAPSPPKSLSSTPAAWPSVLNTLDT